VIFLFLKDKSILNPNTLLIETSENTFSKNEPQNFNIN
jgi:hypothetical protein